MDQSKLISVVVPMYNAEKYIEITLKSIIQQTYQNYEVILVDDGSTDHTCMIAEKYVDSKVHLFTGKNHGVSYARNKGIKKAKGEYILFFDADDKMYPDMLEILVCAMLTSDAELVIGSHDMINNTGTIIGQKEEISESGLLLTEKNLGILMRIRPFPDTKLYKISIIEKNAIEFPDSKIGEDLNFYLKYLLCCKSVWLSNQVICSYRILDCSMSHKNDINAMKEITKSFDDLEKFYKKNSATDFFYKMLVNLRVLNYVYQAKQWSKLPSINEKKELLRFFYLKLRKVKKDNKLYFTDTTNKLMKELTRTWHFRWFYLSPLHKFYLGLKEKCTSK